MVGMLEVDVLQAERIIPAITVCKIISVAIEQEGVLQGIIIVLAASVPQIGNNAVHPNATRGGVRWSLPQTGFHNISLCLP